MDESATSPSKVSNTGQLPPLASLLSHTPLPANFGLKTTNTSPLPRNTSPHDTHREKRRANSWQNYSLNQCLMPNCTKTEDFGLFCSQHRDDGGAAKALASPKFHTSKPMTMPIIPAPAPLVMLQNVSAMVENHQNEGRISYSTSVDSSSTPPSSEEKKQPAKSASKRGVCKVPNCIKIVRSRGRCKAHGGGLRCQEPGCKLSDQGGGKCISHGGGIRCSHPGCSNASQSRNLCKTHGGGSFCVYPNCNRTRKFGTVCQLHGGQRKCRVKDCQKVDQRGGLCLKHGRHMYCIIPGCRRLKRFGDLCIQHDKGSQE